MYDTVTQPKLPKSIDTFKGPPGPKLGTWGVVRSRRYRLSERFQDLQRHPWRGVQQIGRSRNLYHTRARQTAIDVRLTPYAQRIQLPSSGNYPVVQGLEVGSGPNPWMGPTDSRFVARRMRNQPAGRRSFVDHPPLRVTNQNRPHGPNPSEYGTGPHPTRPGWGDALRRDGGGALVQRRHSTGDVFRQSFRRNARGFVSGTIREGADRLGGLVGAAAGVAAGTAVGTVNPVAGLETGRFAATTVRRGARAAGNVVADTVDHALFGGR